MECNLDMALSEDRVIARASSERVNSQAWTVLTIYSLPQSRDGEGPFVAEVVGESNRDGEIRRVRRKAFGTLARALGWDGFVRDSHLFEKMQTQAIEWMEAEARKAARRLTIPDELQGRAGMISVHAQELGQPLKIEPPTWDSFLLQQNSVGDPRRFVGVLLDEGGLEIVDGRDVILHMILVREIMGDDDHG